MERLQDWCKAPLEVLLGRDTTGTTWKTGTVVGEQQGSDAIRMMSSRFVSRSYGITFKEL